MFVLSWNPPMKWKGEELAKSSFFLVGVAREEDICSDGGPLAIGYPVQWEQGKKERNKDKHQSNLFWGLVFFLLPKARVWINAGECELGTKSWRLHGKREGSFCVCVLVNKIKFRILKREVAGGVSAVLTAKSPGNSTNGHCSEPNGWLEDTRHNQRKWDMVGESLKKSGSKRPGRYGLYKYHGNLI